MRALITATLTVVFVLGIEGFCDQSSSQERPNEVVQVLNQGPGGLAGCYQVARLSWRPQVEDLQVIPTKFELLSVPRKPGATHFKRRSLPAKPELNPWEASWTWKPEGKDKLEINWGTGLGGFRGILKRSDRGELVGKVKEYCDSRCGYKRRIGTLHLQKISCLTD